MNPDLPEFQPASDRLSFLCRADELGLLLAPDESFGDFLARLDAMRRDNEYRGMDSAQELPPGIREQAEQLTAERYGFRPDWLPVFCSTRETGRFSAGITLIFDNGLPLVFLAGAFLKKRNYRGYSAVETLAHETVHAARAAFPSRSAYDEYFPCMIHASRFRRLAGNLFRRWEIPAIFFVGLTLSVLHPGFLVAPLLVLLREWQLRRRLHAAAEKLRSLGLRPEPVLLRLSDGEIRQLAKRHTPVFLTDPASLRAELLYRRFSL